MGHLICSTIYSTTMLHHRPKCILALLALTLNFVTAQAGTWESAGSLTIARYGHSATLLPDGRVLAAGGGYSSGYFSSTELYNPTNRTWTTVGSMIENRVYHTATLLPNGEVLVSGGLSSQGIVNHALNGTELYDPTTGAWRSTGKMALARYMQSAILLTNGLVLVMGGNGASNSCELYDPATETWMTTNGMTVARNQHTATLLLNGKVLVAGGVGLASAELFDPVTGMWTPTGSMTTARRLHTTTLLPDGKVLATAGLGTNSTILLSSEVYDPASGTWTAVGGMMNGRFSHTATLLPGGYVFVAGGVQTNSNFRNDAELYQPETKTWVAAGVMGAARGEHSATLLLDGSVLEAGGRNRIVNSVNAISSAELYIRAVGTVTLSNLVQIYDGNTKPVSFTTTPPGLKVDVTYDGSTNAPVNPGTYTVIATIHDLNYFGGTTNILQVGISPSVQTQPQSCTNNLGTTATFQVEADGTSPLTYQWRKNGTNCSDVNGPTLTLTNVQKSDEGFYSVAVSNVFGSVISAEARLAVNLPPVADATATVPLLISVNGSNAIVALDGSLSHDPDSDALQYLWFDSGSTNVLTNGVVAIVVLPVGTNSITLTVSDHLATDSQTISVEVITFAQAITRLIDATGHATTKQSLLATLRAALASIDRSNPTAAVNQLQAFQNQVNAQLKSVDPSTAESLIDQAQAIIDAITGGIAKPEKTKIALKSNGKSHLNFSGVRGRVYIIEASSDMVTWERIGVATNVIGDDFIFDDSDAAKSPSRYYRVTVP